MFFYRVLLLRECSGVAESPETLLRDVTQKVSDIEGRIALAVEVEVEQEEALAVHNDLVGVEVAVDAARRGLRRRRTEPVGGVEKPRDSLPPSRPRGRDGREARLQDVQLVGHRVALWGRDPARWTLQAASAIRRASATPLRAAKSSVAARPGTLRWSHIWNFGTVPTGSGTEI